MCVEQTRFLAEVLSIWHLQSSKKNLLPSGSASLAFQDKLQHKLHAVERVK